MKLIIKWSVHWKWLWQSGFPYSWTSTAILHNTFISGCFKALGCFFFFFLCNFHPEEIIERGRLKGFWEEQQCLGMKTLLALQALGKWDCCLCEVDFFLLLLPMFCFGLWLPFCGGNTWKPLSVLDYSMSLEQEQPHDSCRLSLIKSKSCHMNSCLADIPYQHKTIAEKICIFLLLASDFGALGSEDALWGDL